MNLRRGDETLLIRIVKNFSSEYLLRAFLRAYPSTLSYTNSAGESPFDVARRSIKDAKILSMLSSKRAMSSSSLRVTPKRILASAGV